MPTLNTNDEKMEPAKSAKPIAFATFARSEEAPTSPARPLPSPAKKQKTPEQALASLMRLASRAEKCTGDARRLMRGWGIEKADAESIVQRLESLKFIDDERYASAYVREKVRFSGWGVHKIRAALAAKGIAREIIARATSELDKGAMNDRLEKSLARKLSTVKAASPRELKNKLFRYGLSLGYDYDSVADAVEKIAKNN